LDTLHREPPMLYCFSDGFADQQDKTRTKFGEQQLTALLQEIATLQPEQQAGALAAALAAHQGSVAQRDDITVLGVRLGA
jgi:serine phosphatase RsbU (regulator of sigma subunit)